MRHSIIPKIAIFFSNLTCGIMYLQCAGAFEESYLAQCENLTLFKYIRATFIAEQLVKAQYQSKEVFEQSNG